MVNLYDHVTPLSPTPTYNIQTKGEGYPFPFPYLIFKTSKQEEGVTIPLSSPFLPPLTLYSPPPPNFQTHQNFNSMFGDNVVI